MRHLRSICKLQAKHSLTGQNNSNRLSKILGASQQQTAGGQARAQSPQLGKVHHLAGTVYFLRQDLSRDGRLLDRSVNESAVDVQHVRRLLLGQRERLVREGGFPFDALQDLLRFLRVAHAQQLRTGHCDEIFQVAVLSDLWTCRKGLLLTAELVVIELLANLRNRRIKRCEEEKK